MSVRVMGDVFARSRAKGAARLVLLALADVANDDGEVTAYKRSQAILAAKANVAANSVGRAISALVELGELEVLARGDGRRQTDYRITLPVEAPQDEAPQDVDPAPPGSTPQAPQDDDPGGTQMGTLPPQDVDPIIPSSPVSALPSPSLFTAPPSGAAEPDRFDDFWAVCPRRAGKGDARKAWAAAVKLASAHEIIEGMERYAAEVAAARTEARYIKHPASWLRAERWTDDPTPQGRTARRRIDTDRDGPSGVVQGAL